LAKKESRKSKIKKRRRLELMRKKMALSLVIALAMLLSFGATFDQAKADAILFPWLVKSTAISSLVSVVNTAGLDPFLPGPPWTHWSYFYKDDGAGNPDNSQTALCQDYDFKMYTSQMDVVTVDAACNIDGGNAMFGDLNNATMGGVPACINAPGDRRAFLIVDNNTSLFINNVTGPTDIDGTLYGEAMILELATGAAWGYQALNAGGPWGNVSDNPLLAANGGPFPDAGQNAYVTMSNGLDPWGEVIGEWWAWFPPPGPPLGPLALIQGELAPVTLMPPLQIQTRFFLTPVDTIAAAFTYGAVTQWASAGMRWGNINSRVGVCADPQVLPPWPAIGFLTGLCNTPGIILNDEAPISSTKLKNIVCTSGDNIADLLDAGTMTGWNTNGGQAWTYMNTDFGTALPAAAHQYSPNMMIGKLEWIDGGTVISGTPVGGTFNNFIHVRSNLQTFAGFWPVGNNNIVPYPN
jgi:hypothetical protein